MFSHTFFTTGSLFINSHLLPFLFDFLINFLTALDSLKKVRQHFLIRRPILTSTHNQVRIAQTALRIILNIVKIKIFNFQTQCGRDDPGRGEDQAAQNKFSLFLY